MIEDLGDPNQKAAMYKRVYGSCCDTARDVLALSVKELVRRTELEEETAEELLRILKAEFEEN